MYHWSIEKIADFLIEPISTHFFKSVKTLAASVLRFNNTCSDRVRIISLYDFRSKIDHGQFFRTQGRIWSSDQVK